MRSDATSVDEYLAGVPDDRRPKLETVRQLCREHLPDHEEGVEWGMPVYRRRGQAEFAFASQARYISLYVMKQAAVEANADRLAGLDMGKGCLRLTPAAPIDTELVAALLDATAASDEPPC